MELTTNEWETVGIDMNASKNFMKLSDGKTIGISRSLMNKANQMRKDFSRPAKENKQTEKKFKKRMGKYQKNEEYHTERKVDELIEHVERRGYGHIVLEDIVGLDGKDMGNWAGWFSLGELKNVIKEKAQIPVSLVHPQYTSQACPRCRFIHADNRLTRDKFHCKRCGYHKDADLVAAINIRDRVTNPFLRERLEYFTPDGYMPRKDVTADDIYEVYAELHKMERREERAERKQKAEQDAAAKKEKAIHELTRKRYEDAKRLRRKKRGRR